MKLKQIEKSTIVTLGQVEHTDFRISTTNVQVIMDLLSKGFYQNPIESIVREYCSNAWDSHIEAGVEDQAIVVKFSKVEDKYYIEFIDYGMGLSPERVKEVFTVYFESSKRDTNNQIGSFGLGSKSAYAYTDTFFVTTRHNGVEYQYIMSKNEHGISRLTKLDENPTDEGNGTSIKIPLKDKKYGYYSSETDVTKFYDACKSQLAYFNNVYIEGGNVVGASTFNEVKVYYYKNFTCTTRPPYPSMHIKLGQCVYKIPWLDLGLSEISTPVAVNFAIGEIMPTPNREGIILDDEAKALVKNRVGLVLNELRDLYEKQREDVDDWREWYKWKAGYSGYNDRFLKLGDLSISIAPFANVININLKGISSDISPSLFLKNWKYHRKIKNVLTTTGDYLFLPNHLVEDKHIIYTITGDYNKYKNKYIAEVLHPDDTVWIIKADKLKLRDYIKVLDLKSYLKNTWRARITEYQKLIGSIWKELPSYDAVNPPKDWIKSHYKTRASRDLSGKILVYKARTPEKAGDNYAAYDKEEFKLEEFLTKIKKTIIYGIKADRQELDNVYMLTRPDKTVSVMYMAAHYHKYFVDNKHFISLEDFKSKYNKFFSRSITAWHVAKYIKKNQFFFDNISFIKTVNKKIADDMQWMVDYVSKYRESKNYGYYSWNYSEPTKFLEETWEFAEANKHYDHNAMAVYHLVDKFVSSAQGLQYFNRVTGNAINPDAIEMIVRALKDRVKLDVQCIKTISEKQ